jgi:hypothetical protein|tara:strand:- start:286 stop:579 length:294 start_codon:yes stop_codon:yes gene_type:complete
MTGVEADILGQEWFQIDDSYGNIYSSYYAFPNGEHMSSHYNVYIEQHLQAIANVYCPFGGNEEQLPTAEDILLEELREIEYQNTFPWCYRSGHWSMA